MKDGGELALGMYLQIATTSLARHLVSRAVNSLVLPVITCSSGVGWMGTEG